MKRAPLGPMPRMRPDELGRLATGRSDSLFEHDLQLHGQALRERIAGARVLVVGGAGSIGASTISCALAFEPAALDVVDIDESALAELVRDLHARPEGLRIRNFRCLPLDYGGQLMERLLAETSPYDLVLNFAALKHVRSEKDLYSLLQMLDVNLVKQARFKDWLARHRHASSYFAVSTDKAVNPTSMMGASKRLMEDLVFAGSGETRVTSARFANVAFSNGSLLQSWLTRLAKGQPLAVPADTRRYFVTIREAGEICLLAACCAPTGHILVPELDPRAHLVRLQDVAAAVVGAAGFEPRFVTDEEEARCAVTTDAAQGRYPVLLTPLDTSGEKPYEEFVAPGERALDIGFRALRAIRHLRPPREPTELVGEIEKLIADPYMTAMKGNLVALFRAALPSFQHVETHRDLDQRM